MVVSSTDEVHSNLIKPSLRVPSVLRDEVEIHLMSERALYWAPVDTSANKIPQSLSLLFPRSLVFRVFTRFRLDNVWLYVEGTS